MSAAPPAHRSVGATLAFTASGLLVAPLIRAAVTFHAVPSGASWRRSCDYCGEALHYPYLSAAFLPTGRCSTCQHRLGAPAYLVELAVLVVVAVLMLAARPVLETIALVWWATCAIALAFIDVGVHRLPNRLTYPATIGTLGLLGLAALLEQHGDAWLRVVLAGGGSGLLFAGLAVALGRRGPGLGDAKLMVSCFAVLGWIGWPAVVSGYLLAFSAQALWAVTLLVTRRATRSTHLPFGPFLIGATVAGLALLG